MTTITPEARAALAGDLRYLASRVDSSAGDWYQPASFDFMSDTAAEIRRLAALPAACGATRERLTALAAFVLSETGRGCLADRAPLLYKTAAELRELAETEDRAAFVAGLRALATFLAKHPDVPVRSSTTSIYVPMRNADLTDEENAQRVDEAAAAMGVTASWNGSSTHYDTARSFGPVVYEVGTITNAHMASYAARNSYSDSVQVDEPVAA